VPIWPSSGVNCGENCCASVIVVQVFFNAAPLCASVLHDDGMSLLLCFVCLWSRLCLSISHSDRSFFLLCCVVYVCGPVYALVYPIVIGRSSCCVVYVVMTAVSQIGDDDGR
jgi:hypothetical protein